MSGQWFTSKGCGRRGMNEDLHTWIHLNLTDSSVDPNWPTKFVLILWWAWKWRNAACFEITFKAFESEELWRGNSKEKREILVLWSPPPPGRVLLNTDDAAKGNPGPAGGGGVFRGARGEWLGGFSEKLGCCTSVKAKIKAVRASWTKVSTG